MPTFRVQRLAPAILVSLFAASALGQTSHEQAVPDVKSILRQVSELALGRAKTQRWKWDRVLVDIAHVQMWAKDFEGARKSILGCEYDYDRLLSLKDLAEACARHGRLDEALEVVRVYESGEGSRENLAEKGVRLRWIEYLIASNDLDAAANAVELPSSAWIRSDGLQKLAAAHARKGNTELAASLLTQAAECALNHGNYRELRDIAEAQLSLGAVDAAKAASQMMVSRAERSDGWQKCHLLKDSAVLAAKTKDRQAAQRLFESAIDACGRIDTGKKNLDESNKAGCLASIAVEQASLGDFDQALTTTAMIAQKDSEGYNQPGHNMALCAIAVAHLFADDVSAAIRTAMLIEPDTQYRDDALVEIVDYQIRRTQFSAALENAQKIHEAKFRTIIVLRIANAYAKIGDAKGAIEAASKVNLRPKNEDSFTGTSFIFDYQQPSTWAGDIDFLGGSLSMMFHKTRRRAEMAANAMMLAQRLGKEPVESYAVSFKDFESEVIRELARAQAALGDASKAMDWAQQIGAADGELRIGALIGVAEGILDRSNEQDQEPLPLDVRLRVILRGRLWLRDWYHANGSLLYWQMNPYRWF